MTPALISLPIHIYEPQVHIIYFFDELPPGTKGLAFALSPLEDASLLEDFAELKLLEPCFMVDLELPLLEDFPDGTPQSLPCPMPEMLRQPLGFMLLDIDAVGC
ncbi:hypothetical protein ACJQWK_07733 [Exserohilum turcicum]